MKRWHEELTITRRAWKEHRLLHVEENSLRGLGSGLVPREPGSDPNDGDCPCDHQVGRFRKRDAYDCGNLRCFICHRDKFPRRRPTIQERIADVQFREQLQDLCEGA